MNCYSSYRKSISIMIAKVKLNHSISGLMNYLTNKKHLVMDSNEVLPISTPKYISNEFKKRQSFNSRCKKQNFHIILSFGNKDKIHNEKLDTICRDFIESFFEGKAEQWIAIRHPDTQNHKHIHIALNRITRDGKALGTTRTGMRSLETCRKLEKKYGLQQLSNIKGENKNEMKSELKTLIEQALQDCMDLKSFKRKMSEKNYKVLTGRGISFINKTNGAKLKEAL
ncbi:relaxase/mobilization nuclease domain-containing protein [Mesonia maritima]|uniref:relaxase/mobilization nuclease domain-containing protein n=1 Tax=Mesonia maritima TaxID=1793873 RepID=UPI00362FB9BF